MTTAANRSVSGRARRGIAALLLGVAAMLTGTAGAATGAAGATFNALLGCGDSVADNTGDPGAVMAALVQCASFETILAGRGVSGQLATGGDSITGMVGNGLAAGSNLTATDTAGTVHGQGSANHQGRFTLGLRDGNAYPIVLSAKGGVDLVTGMAPTFALRSVVVSGAQETANINLFTTLIVGVAEHMPAGITARTVADATDKVLNTLSFGFDADTIGDPLTTPVTDDKLAAFTRAGEALAELFRRTATALLIRGLAFDHQSTLNAIAADLVDGVLDGVGADGARPAVAAVANVVSAEIMLEVITGNLQINDVAARTRLDNAVEFVATNAAAAGSVADVRISQDLMDQTLTAMNAVLAVKHRPLTVAIRDAAAATPAASLPRGFRLRFPEDARALFDRIVVETALAGTGPTSAVNAAMRTPRDADNTTVATDRDTITSLRATAPAGHGIDRLVVLTQPSHGTAVVQPDHSIRYVPDVGYSGSDTLVYRVVDKAGNTRTTTATIDVGCDGQCGFDSLLTLRWDPNTDDVTGYRVYFGGSAGQVNQMIEELSLARGNLNLLSPSVELDAVTDLGLQAGDRACFRISAFNANGESDPSEAVCTVL